MRESDIEKTLVLQVHDKGGIAYKFLSPNIIGVPDRIVLLPLPLHLRKEVAEHMFFVECKTPGKKPSVAQTREHRRIQALGYSVKIQNNVT